MLNKVSPCHWPQSIDSDKQQSMIPFPLSSWRPRQTAWFRAEQLSWPLGGGTGANMTGKMQSWIQQSTCTFWIFKWTLVLPDACVERSLQAPRRRLRHYHSLEVNLQKSGVKTRVFFWCWQTQSFEIRTVRSTPSSRYWQPTSVNLIHNHNWTKLLKFGPKSSVRMSFIE